MSNKEKEYCVYMHISPNGKKYIGITSKKEVNQRWRNGKGYEGQPYFYNAINKYGWDNFEHIILYTDLTKEQAEQIEIELIAYYDTTNQNKGYNISKGGKGANGCKWTDEQKEKISGSNNHMYGKSCKDFMTEEEIEQWKTNISKAISGEKHPLYGKHHSEESIEKMRERAKEVWTDEKKQQQSKILKGRVITDEWRKNMSIAHQSSNHPNSKKVICFIDNKPFMIFNSISEGNRYFGIKGATDITYACQGYKIVKGKKVKVKSCGKYNGKKIVWRYLETIEL